MNARVLIDDSMFGRLRGEEGQNDYGGVGLTVLWFAGRVVNKSSSGIAKTECIWSLAIASFRGSWILGGSARRVTAEARGTGDWGQWDQKQVKNVDSGSKRPSCSSSKTALPIYIIP